MSLKNYSTYSYDAGLLSIVDIVTQDFTKRTNKAVITDLNTLIGVPHFFDECQKRNIDPIVGVTITIGTEKQRDGNITLYAKNENGFNNLKKIVSTLKQDTFKEKYTDIASVLNNSEDIVALTGGHGTVVYNKLLNNDLDGASKDIYNLKRVFKDNLNLEIQVNYQENEDLINKQIIDYSKKINVPVFATNDQRIRKESHYFLLQEKIKKFKGVDNKNNINIKDKILQSSYIKNTEQMKRDFAPYIKNITNVGNLFSKFENFEIFSDVPEIPVVPRSEGSDSFIDIVNEKYRNFIKTIPEEEIEKYNIRLKQEIKLIKKLGFEEYFLLYSEIEKNKAEGQRFNLRGSAVSYLTVHVLGLSEIDPVAYGLLPERFLNENRITRKESPDMDIESNDVDSTFKYLIDLFGEDCVAYLSATTGANSTSQLELAKNALKSEITQNPIDIYGKERVFPDKDFNLLNKALRTMYGASAVNITEAHDCYLSKPSAIRDFKLNRDTNSQEFKGEYYKINNLKNLSKSFPNINKIISFTKTLDNVVISSKFSPGCIVVSNKKITNFFSTTKLNNNNKAIKNVIELEKKHTERMGLIKMDVLSNLYLGKLDYAFKLVGLPWHEKYSEKYKDKKVYEMLEKGLTATINQIKSPKQQQLAKRLKVDNFKELVNFLALLRPGVVKEQVEEYINNKNNKDKIVYESQAVKDILEETHGVILFEEQVMLLAQKVGNFSPEDSDDFRSYIKKSIGNPNKDENYYKLEKMKKRLLTSAIEENNISPENAKKTIERIDNMKGYTFSKAHSLSYGSIVYKQALIETNHPAEYMQSFILDKGNRPLSKTEFTEFLDKTIQLESVFLNVDINRSQNNFKTLHKNNNTFIEPSLNMVVKDDNITKIILEDKKIGGNFKNLYDFVERTINKAIDEDKFSGNIMDDSYKDKPAFNIYRNSLLSLINAGAFDAIAPQELLTENKNVIRTTLLSSLDDALELAINPFPTEDFTYTKPEDCLSMEATVESERNVYGFSPIEMRQKIIIKKKLSKVLQQKSRTSQRPKT